MKRILLAGIILSFVIGMANVANALESGVRFSVINTAESSGSLEAMVVDGGSWFTLRHLAHNAILVSHPEGDLLYDTGIGREIEQQMESFGFVDRQLFAIENHRPARDQLDAQSYDIDRLKMVVPGHMHWDHASGLEDFSEAPVWIQENSYKEAMAGEPPGFVLSQYDSNDLRWQMISLSDVSYMGFDKSLDVFGDGSVVLVDLSGHTEGQLGMFVNLDSGQRYFFIGDTTWVAEGIKNNRSRPGFVQWLVGVDSDYELNAQVIEQINQLVDSHPELVVVPAHDERVLSELPRYPVFSR